MITSRTSPTESKTTSAVESKITPEELADFPEGFDSKLRLGRGSYGEVHQYVHRRTGIPVAVKRVKNLFEHAKESVRTLRELQILNSLNHPNILKVLHVKPADSMDISKFNDIYIILEYKDCSLKNLLNSRHPLTEDHVQYFMAQIFRALIYLDKVKIMHRDLKPDNILITEACDLMLCDFNLSRFSHRDRRLSIGELITQQDYRAPEVILAHSTFGDPICYDKKMDMWAAGIILIQLLRKYHKQNSINPLNLGDASSQRQFMQIMNLLGAPTVDECQWIKNEKARNYVLKEYAGKPITRKIKELIPEANPLALDLVERMLQLNPDNRITLEDALKHPFVNGYFEKQYLDYAPLIKEDCVARNSAMEDEIAAGTIPKAKVRQWFQDEILSFSSNKGRLIPLVAKPTSDMRSTADMIASMRGRDAVSCAEHKRSEASKEPSSKLPTTDNGISKDHTTISAMPKAASESFVSVLAAATDSSLKTRRHSIV
ncbi:MAG: protein kinase domain-containing protein [Gammaproteobacteria bacterium]